MKSTSNTKDQGLVRILIYPEGKKTYKAVCLDFDIIEEAGTKKEVISQINEAVIGYIENIQKNDLDDELLNRHADKKYWNMYEDYSRLVSAKNEERVKTTNKAKQSSFCSVPLAELLSGESSLCLV